MKRSVTLLKIASILVIAGFVFTQNLYAQCPDNGNADAVVSQTGVVNPNNALGASNGSSAQLYDTGDQIVLDLTSAVPSGEDYTIRWRKDPGTSGNPNMTVEESSNGSSWSAAAGSAFTLTNTSYYDQTITASTTTRYLRFTNNNVYNVDLDAVSYSISCTAVSSRISTSGDDAEETRSSGNMYTNSSDLELSFDGGTDQIIGMRFNSINVPQGATITNAYIEFETDETDNGTTNLTIWAEDADNAGSIQTSNSYLSSRTKTTASAAWSNVPAWNTVNEKHQTPSITNVIQEIVDRGGWSANNSMLLLIEGTGERTAESYDGESANAPLLVVEYVEATGGGSFSCSGGLLTNPQFESDLIGWWTNGTVAVTTDSYFGAKAAVISGGGSGGVGDNMAASPGQTFELSAYGKSSGSAIFALEFLDASWSNISSTNTSINTGSYQEYNIQATAPANTAYVQVMAWHNAGGGSTTVDGFCLTEMVGGPSFSCSGGELTNPEFESGATGWNTYGSQNITTDSYYGSNAIQMTDGSGAGADQTIAVTPGRIYTMEGYAKVNGQSYTNALLKFYDSGMNQIAYHDAIIETNSYGYFSLSGMAAPNAAFMRPSLWKPSGGGTANYDGICVTSYAGNPVSCSNGCDISPSFSDYVWSHENEQSNDDWMDYDNGDLTFCNNGDGTFSIIGTIIGGVDAEWDGPTAIPCGADDSWELNLSVSDKQTWAEFGGSYVQTTGCGANHVDWDYWDISGTLTGTGCNTGRTITNVRPATGYRLQVGTGGNSQSCNFGLSTWLYGDENGSTIDLDFYAHIDETCYTTVTATTPFSCASGVFTNPEFENNYTDWTTSGSVSITGDAMFGSKASLTSGGTSGGGHWQFYPASEGDEFEVSVYGKVTGSSSAALGVRFYDNSNNILSQQYNTFTNTSYTEVTISSVAAPAGTAFLRVSGWKNSGGNGTAYFDGYCVEPLAPPAPQPAFACNNKMYQSILISGDYWLYEVQTEPVNLIPLVNLNTAGISGGVNGLVFRKQDGYIYIINMTSPWNLYRIGSDYSVQNMGAVSGFDANAYINAADVDANGDIIYKSHHNNDRSLNLYKMDFDTKSATMICDFPFYPGHRNNVGDIALNPLNNKYYGTWDSTSLIVEIDPATCTLNEITADRWFPGANGAFWVSADGTGYGYENFTGNLTEINLTTGAVEIIGTGSVTSQTDGCSCEGLKMHKEVSVDTTQVGTTVTYTYTIFNNWNNTLNNISFRDTLKDGLTWASEPFNLTGGILIGATGITGGTLGDFTIASLPLGTTSFKINVEIPAVFTGSNPYMNQAYLDDLPALLGDARPSDYPATPAIDDPTPLYIVAPNGCDNFYQFEWNDGGASGFSWDLTNGEASITRNVLLTGMGPNPVEVDVTLNNPDGQNLDKSNCTVQEHRIFTATCDADFAGSGCSGPLYENYGCNYLTMGMSATDNDDEISMTFDFNADVLITNLTISDIDFRQNGADHQTWHDGLEIRANLNGVSVPIEQTFKGEDVLVNGNGTEDFNVYARAVPGINGDIAEDALEGTITIATTGEVNSLIITLKNSLADDGLCDGLGVRISSFDICSGSPNQVPVAVQDTFATHRSTVLNRNLFDNNGFGKDFKGDLPLSGVSMVTPPAHGTCVVHLDGSFDYTPDNDYIGNDQFEYCIADANGDKDTTTVDIVIWLNIDGDRRGDIVDIDDDDDGVIDAMEVCKDTSVNFTNIEVEVLTDEQPFEIAWEMLDPYGYVEEYINYGQYKSQNQIHKKNFKVMAHGKHKFRIRDLHGDGLTNGVNRTEGSYKITVDGVEVLTGNADFGHYTEYEIDVIDKAFTCKTADPSSDSDGDGIVNYKDADYCVLNIHGVCADMDFDVDGVPDYLDLDSDNDGIPDIIEVQPTKTFIHPLLVDVDRDGLDDAFDLDLTGARTLLPSQGIIPVNTEGTGEPDYLDDDSDDDGFLDMLESGLTLLGVDADNDGLDDAVDLTATYGIPNGIISHTALLPDEDDDIFLFGGDVDFRDMAGGVLPVELVFFNAEAQGSNALLTWQTATEINNDYFAVLRSDNAADWEFIGMVEGNGNSTEVHNYSYTDENLAAGEHYYRLQQFDFDGTYEYTDVKWVEIQSRENTVVSEVSYYPIPTHVNGTLTFEGLTTDQMDIYLYALDGSMAVQTSLSGTTIFDLSDYDLDAGIYIMDIVQADLIFSLKLILYE